MNLRQLLEWIKALTQPKPRPTPPAPTQPILTPPAGLVAAINRARVANGRPPLVEGPRLSALAQSWAEAMSFHDQLDHGDFFARCSLIFPNQAAAENIAAGQVEAEEAVADWLTSPGHRRNMLNDYNLVGVGSARSASGIVYWCADFVRTSAR